MKTLTFKSRKRSLVHLKKIINVSVLEGLKSCLIADLGRLDTLKTQYAITYFELKIVNKMLAKQV